MKSLGSIMDSLRSEGPGRDGAGLAVISAAWAGAAGESLASFSRPVKVSAGVLSVTAGHPGAVLELRMREAEILASLNRALGRDLLRRISVRRS